MTTRETTTTTTIEEVEEGEHLVRYLLGGMPIAYSVTILAQCLVNSSNRGYLERRWKRILSTWMSWMQMRQMRCFYLRNCKGRMQGWLYSIMKRRKRKIIMRMRMSMIRRRRRTTITMIIITRRRMTMRMMMIIVMTKMKKRKKSPKKRITHPPQVILKMIKIKNPQNRLLKMPLQLNLLPSSQVIWLTSFSKTPSTTPF